VITDHFPSSTQKQLTLPPPTTNKTGQTTKLLSPLYTKPLSPGLESAWHYKINLSQQTLTFLQFESLCYQNMFLTKIVKFVRYLEVKSSLITKEHRGHEIFNFTVKLQKFWHFFTHRKLVLQAQVQFRLIKAGISKAYLFSSFLVFTSIFVTRRFSRKREENHEKPQPQ
jgi:hypothetical protein